MAIATAILLIVLSAPLERQLPPLVSPTAATSTLRGIQCEQERADAAAAGFDVSNVHFTCEPGITEPVRVKRGNAQYTPAAMRAKIQGSVIIGAVIDVDGVIRDAA